MEAILPSADGGSRGCLVETTDSFPRNASWSKTEEAFGLEAEFSIGCGKIPTGKGPVNVACERLRTFIGGR